ncbi:mCpol domain-containing protein [Flectobacillus major]|uniref:mCpol domain-containing protein n=1 Tax=Flectobacillus major TaxID=103 RepID=UPI0004098245|nr:mCpol domain-containing protein [Flectobacillus major]
MKYKFAFFDGDNVGSTIEILLLENKVLDAKNLSENINKAINEIKQFLEDKGEVLIAGGDDILVKLHDDDKFIEVLNSIGEIFFGKTGLTISGGVGDDIKTAIYELSIAKLYGKNQIKFSK